MAVIRFQRRGTAAGLGHRHPLRRNEPGCTCRDYRSDLSPRPQVAYPSMLVGIGRSRYTRLEHGRPLPRLHPRALPAAPQLRGHRGRRRARFEGANPLCGDRITLQLGIARRRRRAGRFTGRGCAISQASARPADRRDQGQAARPTSPAFRADDLLDLLGIEISPARLKCAMLSHETLRMRSRTWAATADARAGGRSAGPPLIGRCTCPRPA